MGKAALMPGGEVPGKGGAVEDELQKMAEAELPPLCGERPRGATSRRVSFVLLSFFPSRLRLSRGSPEETWKLDPPSKYVDLVAVLRAVYAGP